MSKSTKSKKLPQRFLQQTIHKFLRNKPSKVYSPRTIAQKTGVKNSKDSIVAALRILENKGKVISSKDGRYAANPNYRPQGANSLAKLVVGTLDVITSGAAFASVEGQPRDIYIPERYLGGGLHKDKVEIEAIFSRGGRRPEGKVVRVLERNRNSFLGAFRSYKKNAVVYITDPKVELEVTVLPSDYKDAEDGDTVVVEITDFGKTKVGRLYGVIKAVINEENRNEFEMNSILINNGFDIEFSNAVLEASQALSDKITAEDLAERLDLRNIDTFTIDPVDAKDFDDALSFVRHDNGHVEVGVHIADVTHFVQPGSVLDEEALERSTSVYLVDRVCPMLPERISNELCSLRPHEDKFSFSAIFTFDKEGKIVKQWFGKTLIHSKRRFTYEEAQEVIETGSGDLADEIISLNKLAHKLKEERFKNGSIDFDSDEVRFVLDEERKPIGVKRKVRKDAHKLVEEFMLLANRRVAKYVAKKTKPEIPYVYRVHDLPDPERLIELALLAGEFGIKLNVDTPKNIAESLNKLTSSTQDSTLANVLRPMAIRTMAKATYSTDNIGHYGLGFDYYSHFTSPIRRYSDVLAHRILYRNLTGEYRAQKDKLEEKCLHISNRERAAIQAERESIKYKQVEYLSGLVGEELPGVIRSIIDKGLFVELEESQADGMIRFDRFDEPFILHPAKIKATGARSGLILRIGDPVVVKILKVDMERKQIEFELVQSTNK